MSGALLRLVLLRLSVWCLPLLLLLLLLLFPDRTILPVLLLLSA
jgi:hypothetical protein